MKLNHVDLQVSDVQAAREFFERHFGLRCTYQRGNQIALLRDDAGLELGVSNLRGSAAPPTRRIFTSDSSSNAPGACGGRTTG